MDTATKPPPELDLIWGIVAIGNEVSTERQTFTRSVKTSCRS